jgi:DNA-binding CsgD family transcriptional regulator
MFQTRQLAICLLLMSIGCIVSAQTDTQKGDPGYWLSQGIKSYESGDYQAVIRALTTSENMLGLHQNDSLSFLLNNNWGNLYFNLGDFLRATDYYSRAYELATQTENPRFLMTVLNNLAIVFVSRNELQIAESYLLRAYQTAIKEDGTIRPGIYAINLAQIKADQGLVHDAEKWLAIAKKYLAKNHTHAVYLTLMDARVSLMRRDFNSASKTLEFITPQILEQLPHLAKTDYYTLKAQIHHHLKEYTLFESYTLKALSLPNAPNSKIKLLESLDSFYLKNNQPDKKGAISIQLKNYRDSVHIVNQRQLEQSRLLSIEAADLQYQLKVKTLEFENRNNRLKIVILLVLLFFTMLTGVLIFRYSKSKADMLLSKHKLRVAEFKAEQEESQKALLQLEQEKIKIQHALDLKSKEQEIMVKNEQLSARLLYQKSRNELIHHIISKIHDHSDLNKNHQVSKLINELEMLLEDESVTDTIDMLFQDLKHSFIFEIRSRHPTLSEQEIQLLGLLALNLDTKTVASLLRITPENVRKRKERLFKKIGLQDQEALKAVYYGNF